MSLSPGFSERVGLTLPKSSETPGLNLDTDSMRQDVIRIIAQYLEDEGYHLAHNVLLDEANVKRVQQQREHANVNKLQTLIKEGGWEEVAAICKQLLKSYISAKSHSMADKIRAFSFAIHRQAFLEQLERREYQQAFNYLTTRMKPYEGSVSSDDMRDLAYMLTCSSVQESPKFQYWDITSARQALIEQLGVIFQQQTIRGNVHVPQGRLKTLLMQAAEFQQARAKANSQGVMQFNTFLHDFSVNLVPSELHSILRGHTANVKCIAFDGSNEKQVLSGSSDNTVRVWNIETGDEVTSLQGHTSRVWGVDSHPSLSCISASADATIKIWDSRSGECRSTIRDHNSDVYSVRIHPNGTHFVSGGYDKTVRLFDARTTSEIKCLKGHKLGVSQAIFNHYGNLIVSGSKDGAVKIWDITSGLCISTFSGEYAEITGVDINEFSDQLVFATKSSTNVLLDMRMKKILKRFRGHQNSTRHFIGVSFGPTPGMLCGGSEDGRVCLWDQRSGDLQSTLDGHEGPVYATAFNPARSMLASCSEDGSIRLWSNSR